MAIEVTTSEGNVITVVTGGPTADNIAAIVAAAPNHTPITGAEKVPIVPTTSLLSVTITSIRNWLASFFVRVDTAQTLSGGEQTQARANIGAAATGDLHAAATVVTGTGLSISGQQISLATGTTAGTVAAGNHTHNSVNKVIVTQPATVATLTIAEGKTINAGSNITTNATNGSITTSENGSIATGADGSIQTGFNGYIFTSEFGYIVTSENGSIATSADGYIQTGEGGSITTDTGSVTFGNTSPIVFNSTAGGTRTLNIGTGGTLGSAAFTPATDYATPSGTQTLTNKTLTNPTVNNYTEGVVAIGTVTTAHTIALTNGTVQTATLTASTACAFTMPTATAGKSFILYLKQAASTGNGTATFGVAGPTVKWAGGVAPVITATAGRMDILSFVADGTHWYGSIIQNYTP